jgi:signal transduction histidine kinase
MKFTTLFSLYAGAVTVLILGLGLVTLHSIEKARWWDARMQLTQQSYSLHLQLEANVFRLFKQHGDALLVGDRDGGARERELQARIHQNLSDIRDVIAREIQMVGEEEIEELALLDEMGDDIRQINATLSRLTAFGKPLESAVQIERLADLLEREIDLHLTQLIEKALAEEIDELEEVNADLMAFRARNETFVYTLLLVALGLLVTALIVFHAQIRVPFLRLQETLTRLRRGDYATPHELAGSREFRELGRVLEDMATSLSQREVNSEEQKSQLEEAVQARTLELQGLISGLEVAEENRKRLMADISHELRTPLAIIMGEADVALRTVRGADEGVSDVLARIRDAARHTNQIVSDLLTVARQEAGQLRLDRSFTDLRKIVSDAAQMFPQDVALNLPQDNVRLSVDAVRLRQAVLALFHNARRHGGADISATLSATPDTLSIVVEDNGRGLGDDEKQFAFERFFRGSNASGRGTEGTGLGLPIVKSIVEAHGGTVVLADSDLGGLAVRIELPSHPTMRLIEAGEARESAYILPRQTNSP